MIRRFTSAARWLFVTLVIIILTSITIDATDSLSGVRGTLLSNSVSSLTEGCPDGMVEISHIPGLTCVDQYEVSAGKNCPHQIPATPAQTAENLNTQSCVGTSQEARTPWTSVNREQARAVCSRSNKRLLDAAEWYGLALSVPNSEQNCNLTDRSVKASGAKTGCVSADAVYDLVGNVWEWVSGDIVDNTFAGRSLPPDGYVAGVDSSGVPYETSTSSPSDFDNDYFWASGQTLTGMIRGGFYGSGADGGVYTVHVDTEPNSASVAIGFRCGY